MLVLNEEDQVCQCSSNVLGPNRQMSALPTDAVLTTILIQVRSRPAPAALVLGCRASHEFNLIAQLELHGFAWNTGLGSQCSVQSLLGRQVHHYLNGDLTHAQVVTRNPCNATLVIDELRLGRGLELCHDGRRASEHRCVRSLTAN